MKNFYIEERCSQNWDDMPKTTKGSYCSQCAIEVYDFTNKTSEEIRTLLYKFSDKHLCTRMTLEQKNNLNREFELWQLSKRKYMQRATFFTFWVVFGLSIISCTEEKDKMYIESIHQQTIENLNKSEAAPYLKEITDPTSDLSETGTEKHNELKEIKNTPEDQEIEEIICEDQVDFDDNERRDLLGAAVMHDIKFVDFLEDTIPKKGKLSD